MINKVYILVISLVLLLAAKSLQAGQAEIIAKELIKILEHCDQVGFYLCGDKFDSINRGIFLKPSEKQKLRITEEKFEVFVKERYKNYFNFSFFKLSADINIKNNAKLDITQFTENIKAIRKSKDEELYLFEFNDAPSIHLIKKDGQYKIIIGEVHSRKYMRNRNYNNTVTVIRLKNNILNYHMKEAEILGYDKEKLDENITSAIAPIVLWLEEDLAPDYIKNLVTKDIDDVKKFYLKLNTDDSILNKIREEHNIKTL